MHVPYRSLEKFQCRCLNLESTYPTTYFKKLNYIFLKHPLTVISKKGFNLAEQFHQLPETVNTVHLKISICTVTDMCMQSATDNCSNKKII